MYILLFVLFANIWIWKIFAFNLLTFSLIVLTTILAYLRLSAKSKFSQLFLLLLMVSLLAIQYRTTQPFSLTALSNDQIRVRDMRLKEYPPLYVKLFDKVLWIPAAHWLEGRPESVAAKRVSANVGDTLDLNQYFFASHPRQRVGVSEFEKFPYILLPLFVAGGIFLVRDEKKYFLIIFLLVPIFAMTLFGNNNTQGAFSLLPFIVVTSVLGAREMLSHLNTYGKPKKALLIFLFLIFYLLVLVQTIAYETF